MWPLLYNRCNLIRFRDSSHEPGWPVWPSYRDKFRLGFIWEISARFPRWESAKDPGDEFWRQIRKTKQTWRNTKVITFAPVIASATLKAVSLQLIDDAIRTARIHPAFIPETGLKCSHGKIFSPLTEIPVGKTEISELEPRRDLGNRARMKRPLVRQASFPDVYAYRKSLLQYTLPLKSEIS